MHINDHAPHSLKLWGITPWALAFEESPYHPLASEGEPSITVGVPLGEPSITVKNHHLQKHHLSGKKSHFGGNRQSPSKTVTRPWGGPGEPSITVKHRHPGQRFLFVWFSYIDQVVILGFALRGGCRPKEGRCLNGQGAGRLYYFLGVAAMAPDNFCFWRMTEASFIQEHPP